MIKYYWWNTSCHLFRIDEHGGVSVISPEDKDLRGTWVTYPYHLVGLKYAEKFSLTKTLEYSERITKAMYPYLLEALALLSKEEIHG